MPARTTASVTDGVCGTTPLWFTVPTVVDMGEARNGARDAVVRPLSRVAGRPCARPGCPSPARATLSFRYATRETWLEALAEEPVPAAYDLCVSHADRTRPPHGWGLVDQRPAEEAPAPGVPARELGGEHTVAVLAAALRAVAPAPEPGPASGPAFEPAPEPEPEPLIAVAPDPEPSVAPRPVPAARDRWDADGGTARSW